MICQRKKEVINQGTMNIRKQTVFFGGNPVYFQEPLNLQEKFLISNNYSYFIS